MIFQSVINKLRGKRKSSGRLLKGLTILYGTQTGTAKVLYPQDMYCCMSFDNVRYFTVI